MPADTTEVDSVLAPFADDPARSVVITDFDGTLAPIVADPPAAMPLPAAGELLGRLAARLGRVAVVSGRPLDFLRDRLPVDGLALFGQYGVERLDHGKITTAPAAALWVDAVRAAGDEAERRLPGLFVERKGIVAVGLHWRQRPELERAATDLAHSLAAEYGLQLEPGRRTLELRPALDIDKGTVTSELASGASAAVFLGDDRGDMAAFDTLGRLSRDGRLGYALRIAVRSPESPSGLISQADMVVDGPEGAIRFLERLAELLGAP